MSDCNFQKISSMYLCSKIVIESTGSPRNVELKSFRYFQFENILPNYIKANTFVHTFIDNHHSLHERNSHHFASITGFWHGTISLYHAEKKRSAPYPTTSQPWTHPLDAATGVARFTFLHLVPYWISILSHERQHTPYSVPIHLIWKGSLSTRKRFKLLER